MYKMDKVFKLMSSIEKFNFQDKSFYAVINAKGICLVDCNSLDNALDVLNYKEIIEKGTVTVTMFLPCMQFMYKHYKEAIIKNDGCYEENLQEANALFEQLFNKSFGDFFPEVNFSND
jgi:hypothetical protein